MRHALPLAIAALLSLSAQADTAERQSEAERVCDRSTFADDMAKRLQAFGGTIAAGTVCRCYGVQVAAAFSDRTFAAEVRGRPMPTADEAIDSLRGPDPSPPTLPFIAASCAGRTLSGSRR